MERKAISDKLRWQILTRDGFRCRYCRADSTESKLEIDHVLPVAQGGGNEIGNLLTACRACNSGKRASILANDPPYLSKGAMLRHAFDWYANLIPKSSRMEETVMTALVHAVTAASQRVGTDQYMEWVEFFVALEDAVKEGVAQYEAFDDVEVS